MMKCAKSATLLFETICVTGGEGLNLSFHEDRILRSCGKKIDLAKLICPPSNLLFRCKIIYDLDGNVQDVSYFSYKMREISSFKLIKCDFIYDKKFLNRSNIDAAFAKKESADEIIFVKNGLITDTSIANIAIFDGQIWLTTKQPLLYGTTMARLIAQNKIKPADITPQMLFSSPKIALMNAMIGFYELDKFNFYGI